MASGYMVASTYAAQDNEFGVVRRALSLAVPVTAGLSSTAVMSLLGSTANLSLSLAQGAGSLAWRTVGSTVHTARCVLLPSVTKVSTQAGSHEDGHATFTLSKVGKKTNLLQPGKQAMRLSQAKRTAKKAQGSLTNLSKGHYALGGLALASATVVAQMQHRRASKEETAQAELWSNHMGLQASLL